MAIQLTEQQQQQLDAAAGKPTDVLDTHGRRRYVLVPADEYEALRDDRDQAALREAALQNLASRLTEEA